MPAKTEIETCLVYEQDGIDQRFSYSTEENTRKQYMQIFCQLYIKKISRDQDLEQGFCKLICTTNVD